MCGHCEAELTCHVEGAQTSAELNQAQTESEKQLLFHQPYIKQFSPCVCYFDIKWNNIAHLNNTFKISAFSVENLLRAHCTHPG